MDGWYAKLGDVHAALVQAECADPGTREYISTERLSTLCAAAQQLAASQPSVKRSASTCVPLWRGMHQVAGARGALKKLDVVTLLSLRPADAVDSGKVVCVPNVCMDPVQEWQQECRTLVQYAHKVWHGRVMSKLVDAAAALPPASVQDLVVILEALPNFSVAVDALYADLPATLKKRMTHTSAHSLRDLVQQAVAPIHDTLPPRYVPQRDQVTQAMVNWWVAKLSRPTVNR